MFNFLICFVFIYIIIEIIYYFINLIYNNFKNTIIYFKYWLENKKNLDSIKEQQKKHKEINNMLYKILENKKTLKDIENDNNLQDEINTENENISENKHV